MRRRFPHALLIVLVLTGCRELRESDLGHKPASQPSAPRYVRADAIDVVALLPDPPSARSAEEELEYDMLKRVQSAASDADKQRTRGEIEMDVFVFHDVLGDWFNATNCPHAARLFRQAAADARFFSNRGKDHFNRPRPSTRPDFVPLYPDPDPKVRSYPSGHATRATVWAELLARLYPEQREALLERGRQIGFDRIIAGVHYPSDIYAGCTLGHAVARELLKNVAFRAELDQVKAEMDEAKSKAAQGLTKGTTSG
jgi:acid phosphatase (class A)